MSEVILACTMSILQNELKSAGKWILKAAKLGDKEAISLTALSSFNPHRLEATGVSDSFQWLQRAFDLEDPEAIFVLGLCQSAGFLVQRDDLRAFENFLLAAKCGLASAQFKAGNCYATGTGTPVNYPLAAEWYRRATEQGDDDAKFAFDWCFAKVNDIAQKQVAKPGLYGVKARQGDAVAQNNLAGCYLLGLEVEPDFAEAANWCRHSAHK